jgi:ribosomal protein L12E/L44/L45/RPP1/RPP2
MVAASISESQLKDVLKAALIEVLEERSDLLRDVLAEVMEDVALGRAIQEGETSGAVSRDEVFRALEAGA